MLSTLVKVVLILRLSFLMETSTRVIPLGWRGVGTANYIAEMASSIWAAGTTIELRVGAFITNLIRASNIKDSGKMVLGVDWECSIIRTDQFTMVSGNSTIRVVAVFTHFSINLKTVKVSG